MCENNHLTKISIHSSPKFQKTPPSCQHLLRQKKSADTQKHIIKHQKIISKCSSLLILRLHKPDSPNNQQKASATGRAKNELPEKLPRNSKSRGSSNFGGKSWQAKCLAKNRIRRWTMTFKIMERKFVYAMWEFIKIDAFNWKHLYFAIHCQQSQENTNSAEKKAVS